MATQPNPADQTAAEADYDKKFNHREAATEAKELKDKEAAPDTLWKTISKKTRTEKKEADKGRFRFAGRKAGALRNGSALAFIIGIIGIGVVYTSVFAPNIILVNIKEMYTNDLADATVALNSYYWKMMNYKIGQSDCGDKKSIKCKLSTMSRVQKEAFEKKGFTVLGSKVQEDNRDDGQPGNEKPESRYQVTAIIPPVQSPGLIASGDLLYLYSQLSSANKALVYSVFNPKSSFYDDTRFKERLHTKYGMTKDMTVGGNTVAAVNKSFDASLQGSSGGIGIDGEPNTTGGISLGSLGSPAALVQYGIAANNISKASTSYIGLQCAWNAFGKAVMNDVKTAKAQTLARFAMNYLKAADQVKIGTSQDIMTSTLSANLAQGNGGGYNTPNATDSKMYKSIVYGGLPIPDINGLTYSVDAFTLIGAMLPAWSIIMATSTAVGSASGTGGTLAEPFANLGAKDRDYCLAGESPQTKDLIRNDKCETAITASAIPGTEGALAPTLKLGRETCQPHQYDNTDNRTEGTFMNTPTVVATNATMTTLVAGIFGANAAIWAKASSLLLSSSTKGTQASDAIFAGTGEILGDMAMSRGMQPANVATMGIYIAQKDSIDKNFEEVAHYNAQKTPFDVYNKYSFLGSIVHGLNPTYDSKTPLFSTLANSMTMLTDSVNRLNPSANAFYYVQPEIPSVDISNPSTIAQHATGIAKYLLRLSCNDPEYLAILINADTMCNVRYTMGKQAMIADPNSVLDYMEKSHSDLSQKNVDELQERAAKADPEGDQQKVQLMYKNALGALDQPEIDKETGIATPNSEYEKYLNYCVNRQDPWGRSGVAVTYNGLSNAEQTRRGTDKSDFVNAISPNDSGDPYERTPSGVAPAITEGASQDQDWYSGKKCLEQSDEITNFSAYTMMCSVDGTLAGSTDCTRDDNSVAAGYSNNFITGNDILFLN